MTCTIREGCDMSGAYLVSGYCGSCGHSCAYQPLCVRHAAEARMGGRRCRVCDSPGIHVNAIETAA